MCLPGMITPTLTILAWTDSALRAADLVSVSPQSPLSLEVVADIPAGHTSPVQIAPGQAARIMTGAPLPSGADAVIPVEDTDFPDRQPGLPAPARVAVARAIAAGDYVRSRGEDFRTGQVVLAVGTAIRPQEVGLLAMLGIPQVRVHRRPKAAILVTGDELLPVDAPLRPGAIHESNSYLLAAQVRTCGAEPYLLGITPDSPEAVQASLDRAVAAGVDVILSSAGVSVGAFDYVRQVVEMRAEGSTSGASTCARVSRWPLANTAASPSWGCPVIPSQPSSALKFSPARPCTSWPVSQTGCAGWMSPAWPKRSNRTDARATCGRW